MDGESKKRKVVVVRQYNLTELANIYCVTTYIMRKQIKEISKKIGKRTGYYYQTEQVEKIFNLIMLPSNIELFKRTDA